MKNLLFITLIFSLTYSYGQQIKRSTIGSIGNTSKSSSIKLSQSVGQTSVHDRLESSSFILRQGFQQPFNYNNTNNSKLIDMHVFPNPNDGSFTVILDLERDEEFNYEILDSQGRLVSKSSKNNALENSFNLNNVTQKGTYILRIATDSGKVGQSKLVIL